MHRWGVERRKRRKRRWQGEGEGEEGRQRDERRPRVRQGPAGSTRQVPGSRVQAVLRPRPFPEGPEGRLRGAGQ